MKKENDRSADWQGLTPKSEGRQFFVLAAIILPIVMFFGVAAYGFIVWMAQILFFGPPT